MELFPTAIEVGNPTDGVFVEIEPIVDTGATYSMLPSSLLKEKLGLAPLEEMTFTLADGSRQAYGLGEARFKYEGRERTSPVIFGPEDLYLLGCRVPPEFRPDRRHNEPQTHPVSRALSGRHSVGQRRI